MDNGLILVAFWLSPQRPESALNAIHGRRLACLPHDAPPFLCDCEDMDGLHRRYAHHLSPDHDAIFSYVSYALPGPSATPDGETVRIEAHGSALAPTSTSARPVLTKAVKPHTAFHTHRAATISALPRYLIFPFPPSLPPSFPSVFLHQSLPAPRFLSRFLSSSVFGR